MSFLEEKTNINVDENGAMTWKINIRELIYEELMEFIEELKNTKCKIVKQEFMTNREYKNVTKRDIKNFSLLKSKTGEYFFNLVKNGLKCEREITIKNRRYEQIICLICKLFNFEINPLFETFEDRVPCTDFLPFNRGKTREKHITHFYCDGEKFCGCDYAPKWFQDNHLGNNYDDTISYSKKTVTKQTGVVVSMYKFFEFTNPG